MIMNASFENSSITIDHHNWFVPMDIIMIVATVVIICLGVLLLVSVLVDKRCRTVSVMFVCNSCIVGIFFACVMSSMSLFALHNDIKRIIYEDDWCILRGYLDYLAAGLQNHSFAIHAFYRYMTVAYPSCRIWKSIWYQFLFILIKWFCLIVAFVPLLLYDQIVYNPDNQICQIPLAFSMPIIYVTFIIFLIPMSSIIIIYIKLFQHVKSIRKYVTPANKLQHAKRQLKMVRRIYILVNVLLLLGLPYTSFIIYSFFNKPPKYHFRIIFTFVYISSVLVMIALFYCTKTITKATVNLLSFRQRFSLTRISSR